MINDDILKVRVSSEQKQSYVKMATARGVLLSEWVKTRLDEAVRTESVVIHKSNPEPFNINDFIITPEMHAKYLARRRARTSEEVSEEREREMAEIQKQLDYEDEFGGCDEETAAVMARRSES